MKNLLCLAAFILLLSSCKKKGTSTSETTGNISGKVTQYNQYGETMTNDLNNVVVRLDNDAVASLTDNGGNYTLSGVRPGIYTIYFSKPGCGVYKIQQVNFPGNGTLYNKNAELVETPTFNFRSASFTFTPSSDRPEASITINIKLDPQLRDVRAYVVVGKTASLDITNHRSEAEALYFVIPANTSDFTATLRYSHPNYKASELYAKVYTYAGRSVTYQDISTKSIVLFGHGQALPAVKIK